MQDMNQQISRDEQRIQAQPMAEALQDVSAPAPEPESTDETGPEEDQGNVLEHLAASLGEEPERLTRRPDMGAVLKRMQEGVVITLHISRPRFWRVLHLDDLGLSAGETLAMSEAAGRVVDDYFRLGKRSLLPPDIQKQLANVETAARYNLAQHSVKSHWGAFVPRKAYKDWKEKNEKLEEEFWALRDKVLENYAAITAQVIEDSRPLAEDAWRRVTLGAALSQEREDALTHEIVAELVERLRAGEGKATFIENYLDVIREAIPEKREIEDAFRYEVERSVIPLPSLVARDMEQADRIYRERALEDARTQAALEVIEAQRRADLEAIETQRRAEQEKLTLQQRMEREAEYQRLLHERELQREQQEMERDVLLDARRQKERLIREFYDGIVAQINHLVWEVTTNVLESLESHNGILPGRVSLQLRNLVKQLEHLNFVENEQIEGQFRRLRAVIPSAEESEQAARGIARIDTTRIATVVRAIHREVESMQVDLATLPRVRSRVRASSPAARPLLDTASRRHRRAEAVSVLQSEVQKAREEGIPEEVPPPRRRKRTP